MLSPIPNSVPPARPGGQLRPNVFQLRPDGDLRHGQQSYFEISRAESVYLTSTLMGGGDWRWRLCGFDGATLVASGGYRTEANCRQAVEALQNEAVSARIRIAR